MKRLILLFLPLALIAQPQSPNFVLQSETICAVAARDSAQDFILRSTVAQLSDVSHHSSVNYVLSSGFLAPIWIAPEPELHIDRDSLLFGDVWINIAIEDHIVVTNTGNAELRIDSVHSDNPVFPSVTTPVTIPPGQSINVNFIVILPDTLTYTARLIAYSNAGQDTLFAQAHGIWTELATEPEFIDIGTILVGDSIDTMLTLISVGNTALAVTAFDFTNDVFTLHGPPLDTIEAYSSQAVVLRYVAMTGGIFMDTLILNNTAGTPVRVPLIAGATAADDVAAIPTEFFMDQNYPNPFNPSTNIRFGLPRASEVRISIFDILGREVTTLLSAHLAAGFHQVQWTCRDCPSGLYVARMSAADFTSASKLLLLK